MITLLRRLLTVAAVAALTAVGALWWLHDGDLDQVVDETIGD